VTNGNIRLLFKVSTNMSNEVDNDTPNNFIRNIIDQDITHNKHQGKVYTRFPPEPNGYLHIGHAKSIVLNFGIAQSYNGLCNLRFDDTNPEKENPEYIHSIENDVKWLGYQWQELRFSSSYFDQLYKFAEQLILSDKAYVDSQNAEKIRQTRGTLTEPGRESPDRNRSVDENLDLFQRMKAGEFGDGEYVLRAKIDMASPNLNMRDPVIYRIKHAEHHQTGDKWCIYPMYDYTHCISDAIEGITHSLCTLEFEDHRPLYDWFLDELDTPCHPQQIEFARLQLEYAITSKRKLNQLVNEKIVDGWDDPRMPTISGMRRRGYPPAAIREFCERIGVTKKDSTIEMSALENTVREELNTHAPRRLAVLNPLKVIIENYPEDQVEEFDAKNHPKYPEQGTRKIPFSREIYIDHDDFMEDAPKKFFRLSVGREVRLRFAYYITCTEVIKDDSGKIIELRCTYDPESRGGTSPDGRKVKGTIHWVSAQHAVDATVHLYDRLFNTPTPWTSEDIHSELNPNSLHILTECKLEPLLGSLNEERYQFERLGYFCADTNQYGNKPIYNRIITLRDSWEKVK
jgi:glutaminyl-tRNA synthetase